MVIAAAFAAAGYELGLHRQASTPIAHLASAPYPLLDPSVSLSANEEHIINFEPLRESVKNYLASLNISHSFYFEYLPTGINIRDGQDNTSEAASLMKVPLVMDLYKMAEQSLVDLDNKTTVSAIDIDADPVWGNPTHLKPGDSITLRQAAYITLHDSSNTGLDIIKGRIDPLMNPTNDSFQSLDVTLSQSGAASDPQVAISALSYSSILKCLYFACFNTPTDSSQIIDYLTGSAEPNRIAAGVPTTIKVAHKVGSGGSTAQSDCGIVYYPHKPYLECLMFFNLPPNTNPDPYFQHISSLIENFVAGS